MTTAARLGECWRRWAGVHGTLRGADGDDSTSCCAVLCGAVLWRRCAARHAARALERCPMRTTRRWCSWRRGCPSRSGMLRARLRRRRTRTRMCLRAAWRRVVLCVRWVCARRQRWLLLVATPLNMFMVPRRLRAGFDFGWGLLGVVMLVGLGLGMGARGWCGWLETWCGAVGGVAGPRESLWCGSWLVWGVSLLSRRVVVALEVEGGRSLCAAPGPLGARAASPSTPH